VDSIVLISEVKDKLKRHKIIRRQKYNVLIHLKVNEDKNTKVQESRVSYLLSIYFYHGSLTLSNS